MKQQNEVDVKLGELGRDQIVDSTIVRLMKQQKEMGYSELLGQVLVDGQLNGRFKPVIKDVKKLQYLP